MTDTVAPATLSVIEIDGHWDLVSEIAASVAHRYNGYAKADDLRQEIAVWWYSRGQKYLPVYLEDEHLARLRVTLRRICETYARAEKAHISGYEPRDQYRYSPREVLDLIPVALDPDGLPERGYALDGDSPTAKGNLAEGGDLLAALVDVRRALSILPEADLHFLTLADDCSYDWDRVAARLAGGLPDSMRRRHARIAERMARWLSNEEEL